MSARVVVTGVGVVSPIGAGIDEFEQKLFSGCSGIGPSELFGAGAIAGEVRGFAPQQWLGPKGLRVLDRSARLVCVAAHMALCSAGRSQQESAEGDPEMGLVCGTMFGSVHSIASFDWSGLTDGPTYVNPMEFPNTVINSPAGQAAIKHKLRGVNSTICAGLASGLYAIHYAAEFLRFGRAQALLAGGVEELCEESFLGFRKMGAASESGMARPFAEDRDGAVLGEGAAFWMLETLETAKTRGVQPLMEISGFGSAHDAHSTTRFRVRAEGATLAIQEALDAAGVPASDVGCIIASASGSRAGDEMEAHALKNVFGSRLADIPVCAPKAALGESLGASGAFCALAGGLALLRRTVPPTVHSGSASNGLSLSAEPRPFEGGHVLVNAFGCDGNNAALVLKRYV
ncbi:MAG: beta-ketoacyl-[acyl-carrier-protein] synthase family protein [Bryobacteraceae bacterium]